MSMVTLATFSVSRPNLTCWQITWHFAVHEVVPMKDFSETHEPLLPSCHVRCFPTGLLHDIFLIRLDSSWFVLIPYCKTLRCFKSSAISIWVYHSWKLPFNGISIALLAPFLTNGEASNTLSLMQAASPSEARVSLARTSAFPSNIPMWKLMRLIILILVVTAADSICEEVTLLRWRRRDLLPMGEVRHLLGG